MQLRKGDKVRIIATNEGAEIIQVIDEFHALVDTFDGEIEIHAKQVIPYQSGDVQKIISKNISFVITETTKEKNKAKTETFANFNSKKNRFNYELDLHADKLISDTSTKSKEEILSIQMNRLKSYLEKAIELRIQHVYIIHGVGSGRLKTEVETILHQHPAIKEYNNNFHPKYGKGATEVVLKR